MFAFIICFFLTLNFWKGKIIWSNICSVAFSFIQADFHFLGVQSFSFPSLSLESRIRKVKVKVTLPLHLQRGVSTREIWKNFLLVC